jgi:hypothetical protein
MLSLYSVSELLLAALEENFDSCLLDSEDNPLAEFGVEDEISLGVARRHGKRDEGIVRLRHNIAPGGLGPLGLGPRGGIVFAT